MADIVCKWRLYCETEEALVEGWSVLKPTVCFHNTEHTIDLDSIIQIDEVKDNDVIITGVDVDGVDHIKSETHGFQDLSGYNVFRKGYKFTVTAGNTYEHEISYTNDMMLQGLAYQLDANPHDDDYIEVEIVDVDGVVYPADTVLAKFAETLYVVDNQYFECCCADAKTLYSWAYIRFRYVSNGTSDVTVRLQHLMRTVPS